MRTGPGDGGHFGRWNIDQFGLACFDYEPRDNELILPDDDRRIPWHLVSNPHLIAIAHAGGWVDLYTASHGLVRLTSTMRHQSQCWLKFGDGTTEYFDPASARFGAFYTEWTSESRRSRIFRRVWVNADGPGAIRIDTEILTSTPATYTENFQLAPYPVIASPLMSRYTHPSSKVGIAERVLWTAMLSLSTATRTMTELIRRGFGKSNRFSFEEIDDIVLATPGMTFQPAGPSPINPGLPVLFMAPLDGTHLVAPRPVRSLSLTGEVRESARFSIAIGVVDSTNQLSDVLNTMQATTPDEVALTHSKAWNLVFDQSSEDPDLPAVARESQWHANCLKSLQVLDAYFEARYPSQASAYGFIHGIQGAPRDYALSSVPLALIDPQGARQTLEVMMRMTRSDGAMHYAHTGYGQVVSGGIHKFPSDLPIFLIWATTEYIWSTRDVAFLDTEIPFYPKEREEASSVRDRLELAFRYLRDTLGCEDHGMLRVGSGDWSDPISAMVLNRKTFHEKGGSGFNTAFAVYALARCADLIGGKLGAEMQDFASQLDLAMQDAWNGRWFLRGWDGQGEPLGDSHLFLDGQVFCLIANIGGRRAELASTIEQLLMRPSRIGPTILDRPHPVRFGILQPGWDCNGGVWAAINALTAWGLSLVDATLGWTCLKKQMLFSHARAYPHIWYGIWSGPDAYNSWMGDREGQTFVQPATPMAEFPQPNSNAHAGPLLALMRVLGIEAGPDGIQVKERPGANYLPVESWKLISCLTDLEGRIDCRNHDYQLRGEAP